MRLVDLLGLRVVKLFTGPWDCKDDNVDFRSKVCTLPLRASDPSSEEETLASVGVRGFNSPP